MPGIEMLALMGREFDVSLNETGPFPPGNGPVQPAGKVFRPAEGGFLDRRGLPFVELDAHRRAQDTVDEARAEAEKIRADTQLWLDGVLEQYGQPRYRAARPGG